MFQLRRNVIWLRHELHTTIFGTSSVAIVPEGSSTSDTEMVDNGVDTVQSSEMQV